MSNLKRLDLALQDELNIWHTWMNRKYKKEFVKYRVKDISGDIKKTASILFKGEKEINKAISTLNKAADVRSKIKLSRSKRMPIALQKDLLAFVENRAIEGRLRHYGQDIEYLCEMMF